MSTLIVAIVAAESSLC